MASRYGNVLDIEDRIKDALDALGDGKIASVAEAARQYNVPYNRLYARSRGRQSKIDRPSANRRLNLAQDEALKTYIRRCDRLEMPALIPQVIGAAQRILDMEDPSGKAPRLGRNWISRWLRDNPNYRRKKQKKQELNRIAANTVVNYEAHFKHLKRVIDDYAIQQGDTYNIDETGFRLGVGGSQWVITTGIDAVQSGSDTNRDFCTAIKTISSDGVALPPFLVLKGSAHLKKWYQNTSLPASYAVTVSETGYSNDELSLGWLEHFDSWSRRRQTGLWRLLIFDGFGSHCTKEFLDYCDAQSIVCFTLPPHTSHNLQPLDVAVFQSYKKLHRNAVKIATREGCIDYNKVEFLNRLHRVRQQAFKQSTIRTAWELAGIWPWDPERVLYKVHRTPRDKTPPQSSIISTPTPTTPRTFVEFTIKTREQCEDGTVTIKRVLKLTKASIISGHAQALAEEELSMITAAARARAARQTPSTRQVQKGGILTAREARSKVDQRAKTEALKALKAAQRSARKNTTDRTKSQSSRAGAPQPSQITFCNYTYESFES